jgi:tetratricopeptide (TPR) repeat protein
MQSLPLESSNPALIAQHFEAAGELKPAFDYWVKTGVKAARRYAHTETNVCFQRAISLLKNLDEFVTDEEIYQLHQVWGDELDNTREYQEGMKLYHRLQALGDQRQSDLLLGTAFNGLSRVFRKLDEYEKSLHYNDLALAHLEPGMPTPEYLFAHNRRAVTLTLLGDFEGSHTTLQKSLALSEGLRNKRIQIGLSSVFLQIANIWLFKGEPEKSLAVIDLAEQSLFPSINDPDIEMIRIIGAQIYAAMGYPRKAYLLCQEALQKAKEWNNHRLESFARAVRSFSAMALGYMDECLNDLEEALSISRQFQYHAISQLACNNLGDFYRLTEDFESAEAAYLEGLKTFARSYYQLDIESKLAYTRFLNGKVDEGISLLETTLQEAEKDGFTYIKLSGMIMKTSMLIQTHQINQAEQIIQEVIRESQTKGMTILKANIQLYAGLCSLQNGRLEEAIQYLTDGIKITRQNGNLWVESAILKLKKQIFESQGQNTTEITHRQLEIQEFLLEHARRPEIRQMIQRFFEQKLTTAR